MGKTTGRTFDLLTLGQVLLRLSPPDNDRLSRGDTFVKQVGGAELNVAVGASLLGLRTGVISKLPSHDIGSFMKGKIRSFGVSWLFGDLGYFSSTAIGHVKVFARRSDNRILITTIRHGNFIIAPDDPEFIHYLNRAILRR